MDGSAILNAGLRNTCQFSRDFVKKEREQMGLANTVSRFNLSNNGP